MAAPLYFFPAIRKAQLAPEGRLCRSLLSARGLARTFADVGQSDVTADCSLFELVGAGPGGHSGTMLSALPVSGDPPLRVGYFPEWQEWTEFHHGESVYWVGLDKEHPPTPEDLQRKRTIPGYRVRLDCGEWEIPVIRAAMDSTGLPTSLYCEADGRVTPRIRRDWLDLFDRFARVLWLFNDVEGPYPIALPARDLVDYCLDALAVNYRVGVSEQNLLGIVGSDNWMAILMAAIDWPTYRDVYAQVEEQKKTRLRTQDGSTPGTAPPASVATLPGSEGDSAATLPVTEN